MAFWNSKFKYQNQLEQLEKLGYPNTKYIKEQLKKHEGNANRVISDYDKREQILRHHADSISTTIHSPRLSPHNSTTQDDIHANYALSPSNKQGSPRKYKMHINNNSNTPQTTFSFFQNTKSPNRSLQYSSRMQFINDDAERNETSNDEELEHKSSPHAASITTTNNIPLYSIDTKQSTNPFMSTSSILHQNNQYLYQSHTDHTPDLNTHTMEQLYDVNIATDHNDADDNKYDKWVTQTDTVLRSNIEDVLDDGAHIKDVNALYIRLRATKPQSKMRIKQIYNEIKWVRNDLEEEQKLTIADNNNNVNDNEAEEDNYKEELVSDTDAVIETDEIESKTSEYWLNSDEYNKLQKLSSQTLHPLLANKSKIEIGLEACNNSCANLLQCICMHRLESILMIYHLMKESKLWRRVPIAPLMSYKNIYGYQQIVEDFQHLQVVHMKRERVAFDKLCTKFEKQYPCDIKKCVVFARHYRDRTNVERSKNLYYYNNKSANNKTVSIQNDKDMIFQQHCDKIHSYFLHSMLKFDSIPKNYSQSREAIKRRNEINECAQGRSYSHAVKKVDNNNKEEMKDNNDDNDSDYELYPGIEEDEEWIQQIAPIAIEKQSDAEIYSLLVYAMGIFRWQALHGFHYDEYRASDTIRATFRNIKEEVLYNDFHRITCENWNQTLRKSKAFHQSWAGKRIRTSQSGQYQDFISSIMVVWKRDEKISLKEVITLKLYTDFDQLQFELKKCFRFEQFGTLVAETCDVKYRNKDLNARTLLEGRLQHFYHWRMSMQVTLKKFGRVLRGMDLYHGVNEKMILYPHASSSAAFHGPLSTTASFHVAKTFATDKGMVLRISSQYPRLYHCRAFDASLLSDYPEEQEWLVGFIYTRIRKVHTKAVQFDIASLPQATQLRFSFFVLHLFKLQLFSLTSDLAVLLSFLLDSYLSNDLISFKNNDYNRFWMKQMKQYSENKNKKNNKNNMDEDQKDESRNCRIMSVLMTKFKDFAIEQTIARFDDISYDLREYFMNKVAQSLNDGTNIYRISFKKIEKIFINVKEIYLYNYYKLDNELFAHILDFLQSRDNKYKLKQIKFLYYDYRGDINSTENQDIYYPTEKLNKDSMEKLISFGWCCNEKAHLKGDTKLVYGVTIRLKNRRFFA